MATISAEECYQLALRANLAPENAITATAVAMAESNLNTAALGDTSLEDATWGPSVGLWQIRSLKAQSGTGQVRDATHLTNPTFNARSMASLSRSGEDWGAWSTYKNGAYLSHLAAARAAANRGETINVNDPSTATTTTIGAPSPSSAQTVPTSSGGQGGGWDAVSVGVPNPFGWAAGKAEDALLSKIQRAVIIGAAIGLGVALVAAGGWRTVNPS